jgi:polysaccharide biosynthesis/export protein
MCSCAPVGRYVWVDEYAEPPQVGPGDYQIGPGDLLAIRVYGHDAISTRERVRQDGKISVPLLGDVQAAGLSPGKLGEDLKSRLKDFLSAPFVTVGVEEIRPLAVPVLGEVNRPGQYTLEKGSGVLEALAAAGGLTDMAHRDRIFVLRKNPSAVRIRLSFEALSRGQGRASAFRLQPADSVVVE